MGGRIQKLRGRLSAGLIAIGTGLIAVAVSLIVLVWSGRIGDAGYGSGPGTVTGFGSVLTAATPATPPTLAPPRSGAALERIIIPSVEIDAPVVVKGVDENGVMESPDNAFDVAWYDFTSRPGEGSNAVFSGHVDYVNVGPAVFWRLKDVQRGDRLQIRYADGITVDYAVAAVNTFDAATAPIDQIVGATPKDSVTLITCAGTFNSQTRQYDKRLIVRAETV